MSQSPAIVSWRGGRFHNTDIASLEMAEKLSGVKIVVTQGGYNRGGVVASAGTHDGGSVIDIKITQLSNADRQKLVKYLRLCGWAAWIRTPAQGFPWHIHAVRNGSQYASAGARAQVVQYKNRKNGLANYRADTEPWQGYYTWSSSKYNPANKKETIQQLLKRLPPTHVSVASANKARIGKYVSRYTYYIQEWLNAAGYYKSPSDGVWGPVTQAALDNFRRKYLKWSETDSKGSLGIKSATALRARAMEVTKKSTLPIVK